MPRLPERKGAVVGGTGKRLRAGAPFHLPPTASNRALIDADGDQAFRQMIYDLSTLSIRMDAARKVLAARIDLAAPQYNILMVVAQDEGSARNASGVSVGAVAARLHVSQAFIATEAARMAAHGFLEKRPNPDDGRGVLLRLTPRAEKLVTGLAPHLIKLNDIVFGGLSRRDFRELSRIAAQLTANSARALSFYLEEKFAGRRLIDRGLDRALKVLA